MYGYQETTDGGGGNAKFGLNQNCKLVKFEFTANGGKDGAPAEALDIVFNIGGKDKGYRKFAVTKAYVKGEAGAPQTETTDPNSEEMKAAGAEFSAVVTQILECFMPTATIQQAFNTPISDFKQYCDIASGLLPRDFATKNIDIFMQYQWNISTGQKQTFLEIPKKVSYGKTFCPTIAPVGKWTEQRTADHLQYVDDNGAIHPFTRGDWFLGSNFASQQKAADRNAVAGGNMNAGNTGTGNVSGGGTAW